MWGIERAPLPLNPLTRDPAIYAKQHTLFTSETTELIIILFNCYKYYGVFVHDRLLQKERNVRYPLTVSVLYWGVILSYWCLRFISGMSGRVRIDKNGDRHSNFIITQLNPKNGFFETFAEIKSTAEDVRVST